MAGTSKHTFLALILLSSFYVFLAQCYVIRHSKGKHDARDGVLPRDADKNTSVSREEFRNRSRINASSETVQSTDTIFNKQRHITEDFTSHGIGDDLALENGSGSDQNYRSFTDSSDNESREGATIASLENESKSRVELGYNASTADNCVVASSSHGNDFVVCSSQQPINDQISAPDDEMTSLPYEPTVEDQIEMPDVFCTSEQCIQLANSFQELMNKSVNPCDDFYEYACGNWTENPITDGVNQISPLVLERVRIGQTLRDELSEPLSLNDSAAVKMVKELYASCMNRDTIELRGLSPILDFVKSLGGWPLLVGKDWDINSFNLVKMMSRLAAHATNALLQPFVSTNHGNTKQNVLRLAHHRLGLPHHAFLKKKKVDAYRNYMTEVAVILGAGKVDEAQVSADVDDMIEFEAKVAKTKAPVRSYIYDSFLSISVGELQMRTGTWFDWKMYLNLVVNETMGNIMNLTVDESIVVIGLSNLYEMLDIIRDTPKRTQANYFVWRGIKSMLGFGGASIVRNATRRFNEAVALGVNDDYPDWLNCVRKAASAMPSAVGRLYIKDNFDEESKTKVEEMASYIKSAFIEILEDADWIDEITKAKAVAKTDAMVTLVGYNDYILNDELLLKDYAGVVIDKEKYFENILSLARNRIRSYFENLRHPTDRNVSMQLQPANLNAHIVHTKNQMVVTAAMIHPLFQETSPNYVNYAGIGFTIGHELTHGFDDFGHRFNEEGRLSEWWDEDSLRKLKNRSQCVADQYNQYRLPGGLRLNAALSNGENIADNGAIKLSFAAYQAWVKRNGVEPTLPGLQLNQNQIFFLRYAQIWCSSYSDNYLKSMIATSHHAPGKYRVIGPLSNFPQFSESFNCPIGSRMNPEHKCSVW
ncbi:endothelin-converting enzyme homolog [Tubulanus polymorphus]|uniref:endothelin-converting enzyme homolog n=1 Tax=Tubulanus polymorphus TaxID=672921 RepID=UPI003DA22A8F